MDAVTFLQIEPTTRCNFTCGFCCGRYMEQSDLPLETFEQALQSFPLLTHIELQGEGESLMHPRFFEMLNLARKRGIKVSFITNGSYLSKEVCDKLVAAAPEKISISLESADGETFREIRGGKFDKVVRGIETLIAARKAAGATRPVIGFSITVLRRTQDHLPGIIALYRRLGLDGGITMQPLQAMDPYVKNYDEKLSQDLLSAIEVEDLWVRFYADRDIKQIQKQKSPVRGFFDEMMQGWKAGQRRCPWLDSGVFINNQGQATACCMVKDTEKFALGKLGAKSADGPDDTDGMSSLLAKRQAMQKELRAGTIPAACGGCELAKFAVMSRWQLLSFGMRGMARRWFGSAKNLDANGGKTPKTKDRPRDPSPLYQIGPRPPGNL